jgi:hypothetical protein
LTIGARGSAWVLSVFEWLPRVRGGQAMTQGGAVGTGIVWPARSRLAGGSGCDWRQFAGVAS